MAWSITPRVRIQIHNPAPDLVRRHFQAEQHNQCWIGNVTFIGTLPGWHYPAMPTDLHARKVVAQAKSERNDEPLASDALRTAITHRHPTAGLIHDTDRAVLYRSGNDRR